MQRVRASSPINFFKSLYLGSSSIGERFFFQKRAVRASTSMPDFSRRSSFMLLHQSDESADPGGEERGERIRVSKLSAGDGRCGPHLR